MCAIYLLNFLIRFRFKFLMTLSMTPLTLAAFDFGARYPVSTGVPAGGQVYHQIIAVGLGPLR